MKRVLLAKRIVVYTLSLLLALGSLSGLGLAQVITTARISGTIVDPQGAVIPNAEVVIKDDATGKEYKVNAGEDGLFLIASVPVGVYTITVVAQGFKQTVVQNVKTEVGQTSSIIAKMEVGAANEIVTVTSGAEVLQKESTVVGAIISGRQITELPFTSRDALDLVLTLPGTTTPGRPRSSTVNGLPKASLNISMDGINVQDNNLRSSDGFFTYIRPRIDAIEEVQVSTATPGAESAGNGAVQIKFVTKGGTNDYHGGVWWYHRNPALNSNFFFNKINRIPNRETGELEETPRARVLLNQWGFKVGGPISIPKLFSGRDKAFFFLSYDEFRLPEQQVRNRNVLSPQAELGFFRYPGGPANGIDLLALAESRGFPGTFDPTIQKAIADIRASTAQGSLLDTTDPNLQQFTFTNTGSQIRRFPTVRFDFNATSKHHIEAIWNYQDFASTVDFLNSRDPAFPSPVPRIIGSQGSDRFSYAMALRSQITSKIVNEARVGLVGGTIVFFPELAPASFDAFGGVAPNFQLASSPFTGTTNQRRNAPVWQFTDNVSWSKGSHNFNFGMSYNKNSLFSQTSGGALVPSLTFSLVAADPAANVFNATTLPGADATQIGRARSLYAMLVGRISQVTFNGKLDEDTKEYTLDGTTIARDSGKELGFYGQDFWKIRQNLTLNLGLRWQGVFAPRHNNGVYIRPTFAGLFGPGGPGSLFTPGATGGAPTTYVPITPDDKPYEDDLNNLAPSIGIAWSIGSSKPILKQIFGEGDKTVIRAGYSIAYFTGGSNEFDAIWATNPGITVFAGLRAGIEFNAGELMLRNGIGALPTPPAPTFPRLATAGISAADFDPNLQAPYVQSWTFGFQRELTKDTVFEARYVGNRAVKLIRAYNLNEVNIFENGFLPEFINAQRNLAIFRGANPNCGQTGQPACNFGNRGLPGQVSLPIFSASFGGPNSGTFANATFIDFLTQGQAGAAAGLLGNNANNLAFQTRRVAAGLPANLFTVNPDVYGAGSFLSTNDGFSTYHSLQLEVRRRLSAGLLVQGNYTFGKSLTDQFGSSASANIQRSSIRNPGLDRGPSPFDIRHAFKLNYIYELPFGPGQRFNYRGPGGVIGKLIEGWGTDGIFRWQSGSVQLLTSGRSTVNANDSGVVLVGMTNEQFQDIVKIRKDPEAANRGTVMWLPDAFIENTLRAFGLRPGTPQGPHLAPPTTPGEFGSFLYFYGPSFFRADMSIIKRTKVTETVNVEFRTEFLNAFNTVQFLLRNPANDVQGQAVNTLTFGQTNQAYQDVATTNDPGGRLVQFVFRINF
jgi:hypothetical protein